MPSPSFVFERRYWKHDHLIIGIDEVGRGALAGPLTLGAVCFDPHTIQLRTMKQLGINDSKVLSATKREKLSPLIETYACAFSTASCNVEHINQKGITHATVSLIQILVNTLCDKLTRTKNIIVFIDGKMRPRLHGIPHTSVVNIIDGDALSISIAAASIIAKVERDAHMTTLSTEYPAYGWDRNKGYGTLHHRQAIKIYGPTPLHRTQYIRNLQ